MTRIFKSGACLRSRSTAARVSSVGTSPQQAITTSGSPPRSLLAHSQQDNPYNAAWSCPNADWVMAEHSHRQVVVLVERAQRVSAGPAVRRRVRKRDII